MKRLIIVGIIVCAGLLVGSAAVIGGPAGPPEGLDVNLVTPVPLPVTISNQEKILTDFLNQGDTEGEDVFFILTNVPSDLMLVLTDIELTCETDCESIYLVLSERESGSTGQYTTRYKSVVLREDERRFNLHLNSGISFDPGMEIRLLLNNNARYDGDYVVFVSGYFVNE